jgi:hypothetical protein
VSGIRVSDLGLDLDGQKSEKRQMSRSLAFVLGAVSLKLRLRCLLLCQNVLRSCLVEFCDEFDPDTPGARTRFPYPNILRVLVRLLD